MDYTIEFDAPAEKMYQDFISREYWQTLMDAYRFLTPQSEITTFSSGERGTDIVFAQNLPRAYLPPVARTVVPVDMIIQVARVGAVDSAMGSAETAAEFGPTSPLGS